MELKTFVSKTLHDILAGISESKDTARSEKIGSVCPFDQKPAEISFDVAVAVSEGKDSKQGVSVVVASILLGKQDSKKSSSETVSRVSFSVPVEYR